jgi:hypothetical protein
LPDPDFRGEVDDAVDALQAVGDHVLVANVADDQLGVGRKVLGTFAVSVDLLDETIEDVDLVAAAKKFTGDCPTDKTSPARN